MTPLTDAEHVGMTHIVGMLGGLGPGDAKRVLEASQLLQQRIRTLVEIYRDPTTGRTCADVADDLTYALTADTEAWHRAVAFTEAVP